MKILSYQLWLFIAVSTVTPARLAEHEVDIAPTTPQASGQFPSQTLAYYLDNANVSAAFNMSNTVIRFHPGIHEVNYTQSKPITVVGASNIVWEGVVLNGKQPVIQCNRMFGFVFRDVFNLTLKHLDIVQCGRYSEIGEFNLSASLFLYNIASVTMYKLYVSHSRGYGLLAINMMGASCVDSSTFLSNKNGFDFSGGNALFLFQYKSLTVQLSIQNSLFQQGANCFGCPDLQNYYSHANGLGMYIERVHSTTSISLSNLTFVNNTGDMRLPSVHIKDVSSVTNKISFINCTFSFEGTLKIDRPVLNGYGSSSIIISQCIFYAGVATGIDLYFRDFDTKKTTISIKECVFIAYKAIQVPSNDSVVRIQHIGAFNSCPKTSVVLQGSVFQKNKMPCSSISLNSDVYQQDVCTSVFILNCTFMDNIGNEKHILFAGRTEQNFPLRHEENYMKYHRYPIQVEVEHSSFLSNKIDKYSYKGIIVVQNIFISFSDCLFKDSEGTSLQANESVVSLSGLNQFINNTGTEGGALSLLKSRLHLNNGSHTVIENNEAEYGGGLFATPFSVCTGSFQFDGICSTDCVVCTLSLPTYNLSELNASTVLAGNIATSAGHSVFYGAFENCCVGDNKAINSNLLKVFNIHQGQMSSPATSLNWCQNADNGSNVTSALQRITAYPGANFNISLKLEKDTAIVLPPVVVTGMLCFDYSNVAESQVCKHDYQNELRYVARKQVVTSECSNITYSVYSSEDRAFMELQIDRLNIEAPSINYGDKHIITMAEIDLLDCPFGYHMANKPTEKPYCECIEYLLQKGVVCDINQGGKVLRHDRLWIGTYHLHPKNVTVHSSCPFDYCVPNDKYISLSKPNEQCNHNHAGVLCGGCQANLSLALGSSQCKQCSSVYLLLIIPFALAGVALVILLLKCNLTVSTGHINGIIFYANIVHVNKTLLFPKQGTAYVIFSMFIAWLNLDLGIETCFFENMDSYAKVWLQFVFPVYLWIMIGLIVLTAHYSSRAGRLIGSNSVPVLATLFLLSYAKLLRTIIAAISFTLITFEDGSYATVWLPDSNVEYFSPKHKVLFLMALLFAFVYILPFTLLVLLAPCLQAWSHHKVLNWVNKIKPFLDAYQGPYNDKFRFWTGLLLIARVILYIVFASNYDNDHSMSSFWIVVIVGALSMLCANQRIHKQKIVHFLDAFSLINVTQLFLVSWLFTTTGYSNWQRAIQFVTYISISLMVLSLLLIVLYQFITTHFIHCRECWKRKTGTNDEVELDSIEPSIELPTVAPTSSVVEIEKGCSELREPLLES